MPGLMRRLFWSRLVCRVQRSWKVKTGQSTTSFHPATGNPIMTSSTYNRSVAHATDVSKTGCCKGSHGEMNGSNRGRAKKGWGLRILLGFNDLLPVSIRPIKSKRAWRKHRYPLRVQIFTWRMLWRSHWKDKLKEKLRLNK
jgi:hypothetical protein